MSDDDLQRLRAEKPGCRGRPARHHGAGVTRTNHTAPCPPSLTADRRDWYDSQFAPRAVLLILARCFVAVRNSSKTVKRAHNPAVGPERPDNSDPQDEGPCAQGLAPAPRRLRSCLHDHAQKAELGSAKGRACPSDPQS